MNKPRGLIQTSSALLLLLLGAALLIMPEQVLSQAPALKSAPSSSPVFEDVPVPEVENQVPTLLPTSLDSIDVETLNTELSSVIERFGTLDPDTHQLTFDSREAIEAGVDNELVTLGEELVGYQNNLVMDLKSGRAYIGNGERPDPQEYPRLRRFQERAAESLRSRSLGSPSLKSLKP